MGKKVTQASVRISKDKHKQQFNSLIKVLRPKVYIIDSPSFKKLVQDLTGNGRSSTDFSPPPSEQNMVDNCALIGPEVQRGPETSAQVSVSTEASSNNSFETCYDASLMNEEFNQVCNQMCVEDTFYLDSVASQPLDDLLAFQNLESLLLETDPNPFYNCFGQIARQDEISIYDYELYELL